MDDERHHDLHDALVAHHHDAWRWALACCRDDPEAARDVLHDVYEKILAGRAVFARRSTFRTWLFGVIRLTARARRRRAGFADLLFAPLERAAHAPEPRPDPEERAAHSQARAAVAALPRRQREVIELTFFRGCTIEEAAEILQVSLGTARQHYARAKAALRTCLAADPEAGR